MIHKAALVSKTIPKRLHEHLSVVIKLLCEKFSAQHSTLQQALQRYECQSYRTFISHSSLLAIKRKHALLYFRTKKRSQVVLGCKPKK